MDERAINGAAIEAINDLQLDCEIKEVCQSASGDDWCIQFSGKYGRFCDGFQNQFGRESSPEVIREKVKGYLIKQVNKIRITTGRRRKPAVVDTPEKRETESDILAAPLKLVGELFDRVAGITGGVVSQAASVAETARDAVADVAANINPVRIEIQSTTSEVKKTASRPSSKKTVKKTKAVAAKAKKATKRVARKAGKGAKKAVKSVKKAAKKSGRKRKG
ncbi:MAG: hypothetical protein H0U54_10710 [Acidobacteria bacterium]|nr:hypothetical protein [Acidobacteriota bacterium]